MLLILCKRVGEIDHHKHIHSLSLCNVTVSVYRTPMKKCSHFSVEEEIETSTCFDTFYNVLKLLLVKI